MLSEWINSWPGHRRGWIVLNECLDVNNLYGTRPTKRRACRFGGNPDEFVGEFTILVSGFAFLLPLILSMI